MGDILLSTIWIDDVVVVTFKVRRELLEKLDDLVKKGYFSSRSEAIRKAIIELLNHYEKESVSEIQKRARSIKLEIKLA